MNWQIKAYELSLSNFFFISLTAGSDLLVALLMTSLAALLTAV